MYAGSMKPVCWFDGSVIRRNESDRFWPARWHLLLRFERDGLMQTIRVILLP